MIDKEKVLAHGRELADKKWPLCDHTLPEDSPGIVGAQLDFESGFAACLELLWPVLCEARGIVSAHEIVIRQDAGNTNLECYGKALSDLEAKVGK